MQEVKLWGNEVLKLGKFYDRFPMFVDFFSALIEGDVYVRVEGENVYAGTIGRIDVDEMDFDPSKFFSEKEWNYAQSVGKTDRVVSNYVRSQLFGYTDSNGKFYEPEPYSQYVRYAGFPNKFVLRMDDGTTIKLAKIDINPYTPAQVRWGFTWLKGYEGPTRVVRQKRSEIKPVKVFRDKYGAELGVDDFVMIVRKGSLTGGVVVKADTGRSVGVATEDGITVTVAISQNIVKIDENTKSFVALKKISRKPSV